MNREAILIKLKDMITPTRYEHTLGVEKCAVQLALKYGASQQKASIAALLHDCGKSYTVQQGLVLAQEYDIEMDDYEKQFISLMHAPLGAGLARELFGITDQDILFSIKYHTTGRKNMSLLEKIIYTADLIEEGRDYPGVEEIRALAEKDLDQAMYETTKHSMMHVMEKNSILHPRSVECYNSLLESP